MLTVLAFPAAVLVTWFFFRKKLEFAFCLIYMFLAFIIGLAVSAGIGKSMPVERYMASSVRLHNLDDDTRLNGGFFLGTGSINQVDYLFYNVITDDGLIDPERIAKYDQEVKIAEDGQDNPRLETVCLRNVDRDSLWFFGGEGISCLKIFHIPPGSVAEGYRVK